MKLICMYFSQILIMIKFSLFFNDNIEFSLKTEIHLSNEFSLFFIFDTDRLKCTS